MIRNLHKIGRTHPNDVFEVDNTVGLVSDFSICGTLRRWSVTSLPCLFRGHFISCANILFLLQVHTFDGQQRGQLFGHQAGLRSELERLRADNMRLTDRVDGLLVQVATQYADSAFTTMRTSFSQSDLILQIRPDSLLCWFRRFRKGLEEGCFAMF